MIEITKILEAEEQIHGLKAVIFDMDDTLYGEKEYVRSGYRKIGEAFPQIQGAEEKLWRLFEEKKPAIDEFLKAEGLDTPENKEKCLHIYRYQQPEVHLYPGVKEMLERIREKGISLGLITDGRPEGQRAKIQALGLEALFDQIIVTDELGGAEFRKPHPLAFEMMKEQLGVEYAQMCYVGDNIKKDFTAPDQLGMKSIWFQNRDGLYTVK